MSVELANRRSASVPFERYSLNRLSCVRHANLNITGIFGDHWRHHSPCAHCNEK